MPLPAPTLESQVGPQFCTATLHFFSQVTLQLSKTSTEENLWALGQRKEVFWFGVKPKAQSIKEKTDKLDLTKIKSLCSMKDLVRMERQAAHQVKIFASHVTKDLPLDYIKKSQK